MVVSCARCAGAALELNIESNLGDKARPCGPFVWHGSAGASGTGIHVNEIAETAEVVLKGRGALAADRTLLASAFRCVRRLLARTRPTP
jgi:hypothetical protein